MPIRPPDRTLRPADGNLRDDGPISPIIGGGSSSILAKRKRSQVAVACDACRKRKGKCDGMRPKCGACVERDDECHWSAAPDETRASHLKRQIREVNDKYDQMSNFITYLRDSTEAFAITMLLGLREGASIEDLTLMAETQGRQQGPNSGRAFEQHVGLDNRFLTLSQVKALYSVTYHDFVRQSKSSIRKRMCLDALDNDQPNVINSPMSSSTDTEMRSRSPTNISPDRSSQQDTNHTREEIEDEKWLDHADVDLKGFNLVAWTNVTTDNELIIHLVSFWLAWEAPLCLFTDKDSFYHDLKSGDINYCSSMLVNAILALASRYSPRFKKQHQSRDMNKLRRNFRLEAQRQFDEQRHQGYNTLLLVQTGLLLTIVHNLEGLTKLGMQNAQIVLNMAQELRLFEKENDALEDNVDLMTPEKRSASLTAYSIFCYMTFCHHGARLPSPYMKQPPFFLNLVHDPKILEADGLGSYPFTKTAMEIHRGLVFKAFADLQAIQAKASHARFHSSAQYNLEIAAELYDAIVTWNEKLPSVLQPEVIASPHSIALHLVCHGMILDILSPLNNGKTYLPLISDPLERQISIINLNLLSRRQISHAIKIYTHKWGFERGPTIVLQCFLHTILDLRDDFNYDVEAKELFYRVIRAMRSIYTSAPSVGIVLNDLSRMLGNSPIEFDLPQDVWECLTINREQMVENDDRSNQLSDETSRMDINNDVDGLWSLQRRLGATMLANKKAAMEET